MRKLSVLAWMVAASCGISQGTAIVYSNLGPGQGFLPGNLWGIAGTASPVGYAAHAASFTAPGDFILTGLHIPLAHFLNADHVVLSLQTDASGLPSGTALTGWLFETLPPTGPDEPLQILTANDFVLLQAGVTYWIVANPNANDTFAGWNLNSSGVTNEMAFNDGSGWSFFYSGGPPTPTGAFAVYGDQVPEPASWAFAGAGLAAVAWGARRRKQLRTNLKLSGI